MSQFELSATTESLVDLVLGDPEALWALRTNPVLVAGPWVALSSFRWGRAAAPGTASTTTRSPPHLALVYPSVGKPKPPEIMDFTYIRDGGEQVNEMDYLDAQSRYLELQTAWNTWYASWYHAGGTGSAYAATREAAQAAADAALRAAGVLLVGKKR